MKFTARSLMRWLYTRFAGTPWRRIGAPLHVVFHKIPENTFSARPRFTKAIQSASIQLKGTMTTQADIETALDKLALLVSSAAVCVDDIAPIWDVLENAVPIETREDRIQARIESLTPPTPRASP